MSGLVRERLRQCKEYMERNLFRKQSAPDAQQPRKFELDLRRPRMSLIALISVKFASLSNVQNEDDVMHG